MATSMSTYSLSFEKLKNLHRSAHPRHVLPLPDRPPRLGADSDPYLNGAIVMLGESAVHLHEELDYFDSRSDKVDKRFDKLDIKVDGHFKYVNQRFDEVDQRFNEVDQRFNEVDQRFNEVDQRFNKLEDDVKAVKDDVKAVKDDVKAVKDDVNQRFDEVDQRFAKVDQRFDEAKAISFNRFARELDTEIQGVPAPIKDENGQTRYEVGPSFPETVEEFWLLESDGESSELPTHLLMLILIIVNKLASLARHYSVKGWRRWKSRESDDPNATQYNHLEDAVTAHRQRCLRILATTWGLEYSQLRRLEGEAEEMRPTTRKRKADDETESRRIRAKMESEYETEISIVSSKSEEVIVKSRRTQAGPEVRVHRQTTLEEVLRQYHVPGHSIKSVGSTELEYETSSSARAARHGVRAALGIGPPASSERRRMPHISKVTDEKSRDSED